MYKIKKANLSLFDGDGGGDGGATGESGATAEVSAETNAEVSAEGDADLTQTETSQPTPEERRKAYKDLVNGEYKDLYTEDTQKIIDRRFKETKQMQARLGEQQAILDMLNQRYKVEDGNLAALSQAIENDDMYWDGIADELGMNTEQAKEFTRLERQNKQLRAQQAKAAEDAAVQAQLSEWYQQAETLKESFPEFDLQTECGNEEFMSLLKAGVPVDHAYKVTHMDDIMTGVMMQTKATAEKRVADNIKARGTRPAENGTSSQSGFTTKTDVSKLTKADRAEIAKRVLRGETFSL